MPGKALIFLDNSIHNSCWFQVNIWTMEGGLNNLSHWQTKPVLPVRHSLLSTGSAAQ